MKHRTLSQQISVAPTIAMKFPKSYGPTTLPDSPGLDSRFRHDQQGPRRVCCLDGIDIKHKHGIPQRKSGYKKFLIA